MSVKVMGEVWDLELPHAERLVLLALADHADHQGAGARPSVPLLAWKTGYSERQVQRVLDKLEAAGLICPEGDMKGGRGRTVCYRVVTTNGVKKSPFREKGDNMSPFRGQNGDIMTPIDDKKGDISSGKGDIAMSPEPIEPKKEREDPPYPTDTPPQGNDKQQNDKAPKAKKPAFCPPTLEQCVLVFEGSGRDALEGEEFFNYWQGVGWKRQGRLMSDWEATARARIAKLKIDDKARASPGRNGHKAPAPIDQSAVRSFADETAAKLNARMGQGR
jgi:hypothetical protein